MNHFEYISALREDIEQCTDIDEMIALEDEAYDLACHIGRYIEILNDSANKSDYEMEHIETMQDLQRMANDVSTLASQYCKELERYIGDEMEMERILRSPYLTGRI